MTIEEYRKTLIGGTQGSGSSSASSGIQALRERLLSYTPEMELEKIYADLNQSYDTVRSTMDARDMKSLSSALAAVRRNTERLQAYSGRHPESGLTENLKKARENYQTMWMDYDRMKKQQAAEASPMAAGMKIYNAGGAGQLMSPHNGGTIGIDVGYMTGAYGDKWKSYTEAADFEEFAARGAAIQNPSPAEAFFGKKVDDADIGNIVTYSRDNWERIAMGEANGSTMSGRSIYKYMSEAEVKLYNYLLAKEGAGKAQEYLDELEETLNQRMGGGQAKRITGIENGVGRAAAMGLYALDAGTDQAVSGMRQYLTKENLPTSPMQYGSQMIGEQLKGFGGDMYQAAQTVGNMLPSIAVGMLNPVAGSAAVGVSSAGNAYGQALDEGYSEGQSRLYGTMVGAFEACMQYAMGGIGALGGISTGKLLSKAGMIDNAFLRIVAKLGVNIGSEIAEEELQLQLEPVLRTIILGDEYTAPTIQEMLETAVVTALSTGMLEGGGTVTSDVSEGRVYKDIYGQDARSLVERGLDIDPQNAYAQKLQEQLNVGKSLSGHQLMNLVQQNEAGMVRQDMADIQGAATARLVELGETGDVHAIGAALAKQAAGEKLTRAERNLIENSKYGQRVANELNAENIRSGEYASGWAEQIGTSRINPGEYGRGIVDGTDARHEGAPESVSGEELTPSDPAGQLPLPGGAAEATVIEKRPMSAPEAVVSERESTPENDLMAREVESITGIEGMSDEAAMRYWGTEFTRIQMEITKAYANGDTEAAGVYEELNRLMGEAAVQGGGDIKATVAWLKGAIHGSNVSDGAGRRDAGERTSIEAGGMGSQRHEDYGRRLADGGADRAGYVPAAWESAEDLGIPGGTSDKINGRVPRSRWTQEMASAFEEAEALGYSLVYVTGGVHVRNDVTGGVMTVTGATYGQNIVVQADHRVYTPKQIADHEIAHVRMKNDPAILMEAESQLIEQCSEMEIFNMVAAYAQGFRFCYGTVTESMTADEIAELNRKYLEELVCDAYAGLDRHFMRGAGRRASGYRDIVVDIMESRIGMGNGSGGMPGARYSVRPEFEGEFWTWYNATNEAQRTADGGWFRVGQTSDALKSIGIRDSDIYWRKSKVGYILQEHVEMTPELLVQVPQIIEDPLIVMKSRTQADSITLFAELAAEKRPVMAAINLKPIPTGGMEAEFVLIASAYSRSAESARNLIKNSEILYLNADKKRTDAWLMSLGLQLPSGQPAYGPVGNISYADGGVKIQGVQYSEWVKGTDEEFDGPKLRSNYPGLTEYDRYLESRATAGVEVYKKGAEPNTRGNKGSNNSLRDGINSNISISETSENSNTEFDGPKLRSNYPGLTEYDRYLEDKQTGGASRFSADDAGKAPEEMTAAELRRAVQGDQSLLEAYARIERTGGLTPEARRERDAAASRLVKERELLQKKNEEMRAERQAVRERQKARTVPTRALADFEKEMLDAFSTQSGMRSELGAMVRRFGEDSLQRGAVSYEDRKRLMDRLYEAGAVSMEADPYYQDIRSNIAGTRIYVDEGTRHEFGDGESYNAFRREAFGAGVILTSDKGDAHVDGLYHELASMYPGSFRHESGDMREMLGEIVDMARQGKAENVSLAEMMGRVEKDTGWSVADQMEAMERKVDAAIDKFIEKAALESDLKARSAVQLAQEREERRKAMERQAERKALQEQRRRVFKLLQKAKRYERQMPKDLREQLKGILEEMDTIAMGLANEMRWSDKYQATWRDLVDMYKHAEKYDPNFLPNPEILQMIKRLEATKVAQLEPDALQEMFDVVTAIFEDWHNRKNMASAEEFALFSEVADNAIEELRSSKGRKKPKGKIRGAIADGSWKLFNADQLTPVNFIEMMGGWRRDGAFFKAFGRQGETGERNEKAYKVDAARMLDNFAREHADWMKTADGQGKSGVWHEYEVPVLGKPPKMGEEPQYIGTQKVWMTPMMRVHLYLESLNDQNMAHVQEGGRTFADKALYAMGRRKEAFDNGVTVMMSKETVRSIVADMTAEEKAFAKMLHDYYNVYSPTKINPVSNVILGYDKAITENYAPIQTNESYNATQIGLFDITAEGVGVMKERVAKSGTPTYNVSALEAFERHVNQTARYVGYTIPVHNMQRLLNWKMGRYVADEDTGGERFVIETTMMDEIKRKWGQQGVDAIVKYLNDMQGSKPDERNAIQEIMVKVQSQYISATFGANPSVVLKQLGSFAMAGSELGFRNMPVIPRRVDTELIAKYTPELAHRKLSGATSETAYLKDNPNWTQSNKVMRFAFGGEAITWMDSLTAKALWPWAENYVRKNFPELEVGTREQIAAGQSPFYRKVAEVYNDAVTNTQSMADVSHRPTMQRSKSELARGMTLFKSDAIQGYNMLRRHAGEYARARKDGDKKAARMARVQLANSVTGIILSNIWGQSVTLLMALIANGAKWYRDDEGELTLQSVGTEFLSGLIKNMAGMVTLGEELASFILAKINGEGWSSDADIELLIVEAVNDMKDGLADAGSGLWSVAQEAYEIQRNGGNAGEYLKKHAGEVAGYVGSAAEVIATYIGGVPVKNLKKYLLGAFTAVWPELATTMKNVFTEPTKDALSGLRGESLAVTVGDILAIRDIQADDGTAAELARLYEAGERGGVPGSVTEKFTVNGAEFAMNAAQLQEYERVYAEAIGGNLDALVESDAYIEANDETRAKMLERLYTYATQAAKRTVAPEFEGDTWTSKAAEAESEGVPVSAYAALQAQGFSKMADKIAYIDGMGITAEQKGVLYYYAVASDARREDADDMIEDGMGWDDVFSAAYEDLCAVIPDEPESADEPDEDKIVEPVGWTGYYPGLQLPVW